ncbi:MAG: hypothetical protein U1F33_01050 [Alphaproteobacteria bacterium]
MGWRAFPCVRLLAIAVVVLSWATASDAAETGAVAGWPGLHWGMTTAELDAALVGRIRPLKGRLDYGQTYAERAVFDVMIGGEPFTAFFQMDRETGRLSQVLLELRRSRVSVKGYNNLLFALRGRYGPPAARCIDLDTKDTPRSADIVWRQPTTTVHAVFLDFYTTSILFVTANADVDPLETYYSIRRVNERFLPRRILVRESPDLPPPTCPR